MEVEKSTIKQLHQNAMNFAQQALVHQCQGHEDKAKSLFEKALKLECKAAMRYEKEVGKEPTRSTLFESAAFMACHCGQFEKAISLAKRSVP